MNRRQLLAKTGVLSTGLLGMSTFANTTRGQETNGSSVDAYTDAFTTENLGPHNRSLPLASGELIGDTLYLGTKTVSPAGIATHQLDSGQTTFRGVINNESSIWGSTSINNGNDIYFASAECKLYHFDIDNDTITDVFDLEGANRTWDVDSADGDNKIYIGSRAPSQIWEYDPSTGEGGLVYGPKLTGAEHTRSISVDSNTIYAGTGKDAQFIAVDRETEEKEVILTGEYNDPVLSNESFVYEVNGTNDYVAFGTSGTPLIGYIDKQDYNNYHTAEVPGLHPAIGALIMRDNIIYFTAKFPGILYKYDISTDEFTQLAELPEISNRDLFFRDDRIIGVSGSNYVWTYDIESGSLESTNLLSGDLKGVPQSAQSLSGHEGKGYVGGNSQTSVHDAETGSVTQFNVPGGSKSQEWVDDVLYVASYSNGDLVKYNPEASNSKLLPRVARSQPTGRVRPRGIHYDENTETLFIGTQKDDVDDGGDLFAFDPKSEQVVSTYQNFFNDQVASITSLPNNNSNNIYVADNSLVEVDPSTGEKLQELPTPNGEITGLTALDRPRYGAPRTTNYVYGIAGTTLFAVEPASSSLVFEKDLPGGTEGRLRTHQGLVFGAGNDKMFVCDPGAEEVSIALDDLNGQWHNWRSMGIDENHAYAISGTDLLKVNLPRARDYFAVDWLARLQPSTTEASVGERITFQVEDTSGEGRWIESLDWSFGDGTTASGWWSAHRYDDPGTYTVTLEATDNTGHSTTYSVSVTVSELSDPIARVKPSTTEASAGERITFQVEDTSDENRWIESLDWSFGDGTTASGWWNDHRYDDSGTYTVTLEATDNTGHSTTYSVTITIT